MRAKCLQIRLSLQVSLSANLEICVPDRAFDLALTRETASDNVFLCYKYDPSPSSQADFPFYDCLAFQSIELHTTTLYIPQPPVDYPRSPSPVWLVTPPSRAQQPLGDAGVHGWCMLRE